MPANDKIMPASPENIIRTVQVLRSGGLVGIPTETVYGIAANALDNAAVKRLYAAKNRPHDKPVIAFVADLEMAGKFAIFTPLAERLAFRFWPGQLTMVLEQQSDSELPCIMSSDGTIAMRIPAKASALELLRQLSGPLAVTSANISGSKSPISANDMEPALFDRIELALGLATRSPALAALCTVFLLSLAGIPPLMGFVGKFMLFSAALQAGYLSLVLAALVNSAIALYFYVNIIRQMYLRAPDGPQPLVTPVSLQVVISLCGVSTIVLGLFPSALLVLLGASGIVNLL